MTKQEIEIIIRKYSLSDNGDGNLKCEFPKGHKPTDSEVSEIKTAKPEIISYFAEIKAAKIERERRIAAIAGIEEIKSARIDWETYHYKFDKAMERGDCRFPNKPASDVEALKKQYPRAAAYLKAEAYIMASNVDKYSAGKKALERIINGEDNETILEEMEAEWSAAAEAAVWNS